MLKENKNNKTSGYRIEESESDPHGDVYQLEIHYYFDVIDNMTNKSIMQFRGEYSASLGDNSNWENEKYTGVDKVEFSDDGKYVLVHTADREPEKIMIPD